MINGLRVQRKDHNFNSSKFKCVLAGVSQHAVPTASAKGRSRSSSSSSSRRSHTATLLSHRRVPAGRGERLLPRPGGATGALGPAATRRGPREGGSGRTAGTARWRRARGRASPPQGPRRQGAAARASRVRKSLRPRGLRCVSVWAGVSRSLPLRGTAQGRAAGTATGGGAR